MSYKLNKSSVDFLYDHDLISKKYNEYCDELLHEIIQIQIWLESHIVNDNNTQYYESYFHTLVHENVNNLISSERTVFYIDVSDMPKAEAYKILKERFDQYKKEFV